MIDTLKTMLPMTWRNLWRNPRRTGITLIVVAVGLWSILFFNAFMLAWMQSSKDTTLQLLIGSGQIHATGYMDDPSIDTLMAPPDAALTAALDRRGRRRLDHPDRRAGGGAQRIQDPVGQHHRGGSRGRTADLVDPRQDRRGALPDRYR